MNDNLINISYSKTNYGAKESKIDFFNGIPNLKDFFYSKNKSNNRRFFIIGAKVASLECMQDFISLFNDDIYENDILIILGSGEAYKNIDTVLSIVKKAMENDFGKDDVFIGIGGGVICDISAFAASIYKRGVNLELVPTTLLAIADASIGGQTSCDIENFKNMIGTFYPARNIYVFTEFTQYTSNEQYKSGLAEVFKTALVSDEELYEIFKNHSDKILSRDKEILNQIIKSCVKAKSKIVEEDPGELGIRKLLNLGHTFAHALETIIGLGAISHGEAVAWGIGRAINVSWNKELCKTDFKNEIIEILELYGWETKSIPPLVTGGGIGERFLNIMHKDKRTKDGKINLILPKSIEDIVIEEVSDNEILAVLK